MILQICAGSFSNIWYHNLVLLYQMSVQFFIPISSFKQLLKQLPSIPVSSNVGTRPGENCVIDSNHVQLSFTESGRTISQFSSCQNRESWFIFLKYMILFLLSLIGVILIISMLFVSSHIKMMHLSDPTCYLFIAFIYSFYLCSYLCSLIRELSDNKA